VIWHDGLSQGVESAAGGFSAHNCARRRPRDTRIGYRPDDHVPSMSDRDEGSRPFENRLQSVTGSLNRLWDVAASQVENPPSSPDIHKA
jgi:hypothetical protein